MFPTQRHQRWLIFCVICGSLMVLTFSGVSYRGQKKPAAEFMSVPKQDPISEVSSNAESTKAEVRPKKLLYSVVAGDSLAQIADKYALDIDTLLGANPELNPNLIYPGQQLVILGERGVLHTIGDGQTLWSIARQYGVQWQRISASNQDVDPDALQQGDELLVPGAKLELSNEGSRGNVEQNFNWPAQGVISSPYGLRWGRLHAGIDVAADYGDRISAAGGGVVTYAGWQDGYGLMIVIEHGRGWQSVYAHAGDLYVADGDIIRAGQCIASIGSTGNSTGPHLHFEIRYQGVPINPMQYLP